MNDDNASDRDERPESGTSSQTFAPTASAALLRRRAAVLQQIRAFFDARQFVEVQTPCLSADTVVDTHLEPLLVPGGSLQLSGHGLPPQLYLQTSPEFAMKRLLTAGLDAIYQIGPAFRAGERGPLHNPEFTMLEWYRTGDRAADAADLLDDLAAATLGRGRCERITYRQLFHQAVGIDPIDAPLSQLQRLLAVGAPELAESLGEDRDGLLDAILATQIQPQLPADRMLIISHYPLSQAALAQASLDDPQTAERFEMFAGPIELANGYGELLDPDVLQSRAAANNQQRQRYGRQPLPEQSRLIEAMRCGLPPSAGVAVGLDRWVMVAAGCQTIDQVLAFPIERA